MSAVEMLGDTPFVKQALQDQGIPLKLHTRRAQKEREFCDLLAANVEAACTAGNLQGRSNEAIHHRFVLLRTALCKPAPPVSYMRKLATKLKVSMATVRAAVRANTSNDRMAVRRIMYVPHPVCCKATCNTYAARVTVKQTVQ